MAKRKIIRHLEFYGYPDQNTFQSAGSAAIDLSDIREKNREQDEEIDNLDKVHQSDFNALSGVVDSLIDATEALGGQVAANTSAITAIHDWIDDFSDDISGYTDLDERVDEVESGITELSDEIDELSGTVETLSDELDDKLDSDEADEKFATKEDTYTKDDIDGMLSGYTSWDCEAIAECVSGSGFITKEEADENYPTKEEISAITQEIADLESLSDRIDTVSGDLASFSSTTNSRMTNLETRYETFESNVNRRVNTISATVVSFEDDLIDAKGDIRDLQEEMERKASKVSLEEFERRLANDEAEIANKVNNTDFDAYKVVVGDKLTELVENKADKSDISAMTDNISAVTALIDAEREARENADTALSDRIDGIDDEIDALRETDSLYGDRISALESGLTQEIADRQQADIDLIGTPEDSASDDTIWGAKKYAVSQRNLAISSANTYTNNEIANLRSDFNGELNNLERELSKKANTDYVNELVAEVTDGIQGQIDTSVAGERQRAQAAENNLQAQISEVVSDVRENDGSISNLADRLNAITTWDGVDPAEYTNEGNGVLDVLHREFHEFEKTHGLIKEIKVVDGNLVIVYFTEDGEAESVIPIGQIVDLEDYYTKDEVDSLINEAISGISFDDYYTKDEVNSAITVVDEKVEENKTAIQSLFDKLGYTDNETLVTNNEYEAAFGKYNQSTESDDPSEKTVFSIGGGTADDDRKNLVEVKGNGDVYLWIEGEFMNINSLLGQLAHETYYDSDGGSGYYDEPEPSPEPEPEPSPEPNPDDGGEDNP